ERPTCLSDRGCPTLPLTEPSPAALARIKVCLPSGREGLRGAKEIGPSVVPRSPTLAPLVMANGRGVSLIRYARNAQQCGDHRRRHHSKATAANEEGAACFIVFGVFDFWNMLSHGSRPFSLCSTRETQGYRRGFSAPN